MAFDGTFNKLTDGERQALLGAAERRTFQDGEIIIRQGQPLEGIYVVAQGHVNVTHAIRVVREQASKDDAGAEYKISVPGQLLVKIARLGRGAIFGEMSFVDREVTSAHVVAAGAVDALFIDRAVVQRFVDADTSFAGRFYHSLAVVLSRRLRAVNSRTRRR